MASRAAPLLAVIKQEFYPFAKARGFERDKSINPLFKTFRRRTGTVDQVVEIQWDKYWRPCFVINFGRAAGDERIDYEGRLQRKRGGGRNCWFGTRRPWPGKLTTGKWSYTPEEVLSELVAAFDELETWWEQGVAGPHIDLWRDG